MLDSLSGPHDPFVSFFGIWARPASPELLAEPCPRLKPEAPNTSPCDAPLASGPLADISIDAPRLNVLADQDVTVVKQTRLPEVVEDVASSPSPPQTVRPRTQSTPRPANVLHSPHRQTAMSHLVSSPDPLDPEPPPDEERPAGAQDNPIELWSSSQESSTSAVSLSKWRSSLNDASLKRKRSSAPDSPRKSPTPSRSKSPRLRPTVSNDALQLATIESAPSARVLAPSSSLSVLSRTPELSQPLSGSSYRVPPEGHTTYVDDSEEEIKSGSDGVLEEDSSAPKHEPITSRLPIDLYDSDSSLEDLDTLMLRTEPVSKPRRRTNPGPQTSGFSLAKGSRLQNQPVWSASMMKKLVSQSQRATVLSAELEQAKDALEAIEAAPLDADSAEITEGTIADLVKAEDGAANTERIKQAVDRTDLVAQHTVWHFFNSSSHDNHSSLPPLPIAIPPAYTWLKDAPFREQVFLSGLAREQLPSTPLPDEISTWLWDSYLTEPREELALAYLGCLDGCLHLILVPNRLRDSFAAMNAKEDSLSAGAKLLPVKEIDNGIGPRAPLALRRLLSALRQRTVESLSEAAVELALQVLLRLAIDSRLLRSNDLSFELRQTLGSLLGNLDKGADNTLQQSPGSLTSNSELLQSVSRSLLHSVDHPPLQLSIIQSLPTNDPHSHTFARRLALCFFLSNEAYLTFPLTSARPLSKAISNAIYTSPHFNLTHAKADYRSLTACIELLDFAIADGFGRPLASAPKEEREAFDSQVDAIMAALSQLSARVVDTGASHMQRTEAKASLGRLLVRLERAVRTKPKPQVHVFEDTAWSHSLGPAARGAASRDARNDALHAEADLMRSYFRPKVVTPEASEQGSAGGATIPGPGVPGCRPSAPVRADEASAGNALGGAKDQEAREAECARPLDAGAGRTSRGSPRRRS